MVFADLINPRNLGCRSDFAKGPNKTGHFSAEGRMEGRKQRRGQFVANHYRRNSRQGVRGKANNK